MVGTGVAGDVREETSAGPYHRPGFADTTWVRVLAPHFPAV